MQMTALSPSSSASSSSSRDSRHRERRHRHAPDDDEDTHRRRRRNRQRKANSSRNSDDLYLPLDREFLPLQDEQEQEQVRDQVICMIFDLPQSTQFYQDFSCAIASTLAMHGRMYPTSSHVCFYSNVFGRERKILIPYESIREVEKTTTMMFQHAIRLATVGKDEYTFTSFWGNNRDSCYDLIQKTRDRVLRELRPTAANSTESRYPVLPTSPNSPVNSPVVSPSQSNPAAHEDEEVGDGDEATVSDDDVAAVAASSKSNVPVAEVASEDQITPRRSRVVSDVDSVAPKDISMTQVLEESFPVSVKTFMQLFYLDNAPFGLDKFNEQTGSTEMTINPWMTSLEEEKSFGMTRSLQFRVPIDAPIGPKSSQVDVLQCLKEGNHGKRLVESSTRLVDIPYGDYFSVEDRWTIVPHSSNPNACKINIELKVVFGKSTFWKNTIETRAISDNRAKWEKWVRMAQEFLDTRELNDAADCSIPESPPTSTTSSDKATPQDDIRQNHGPLARRRSRSKAVHRHRSSTASAMPSAVTRTGAVKVFPWVLVLLLLLVILRLQMMLSNIEQSLQVNTEMLGELQQQIVGLQACPVPV